MLFLFEWVMVNGLLVDWYGGLVVVFGYFYFLWMYCVGYVVFNFGEVLLYVSFGGYVMDLWSGFYDLVLVLDYKSLYLLIICIFLIDFVGLVEGMV